MAFKVIGREALVRNFRAIPQEVDRQGVKNARTGAEPIRDLMSQLAPRGNPPEPNVSNVVVNEVRSSKPHVSAVWIGPSSDAFYAYFLEFGTKFMSAKPFARPAFDREWDSAQNEIAEAAWNTIKKAIR